MSSHSSDFINFILFWMSISDKYERIKSNPEKREKSAKMGRTALALSIMGSIFTTALAVLAYVWFASGEAGKVIGAIIAVLFAVAFFIYMNVAGVVHASYQMKLNNKPIGKTSLVVSLVLMFAPIVAVIVFVLIKLL